MSTPPEDDPDADRPSAASDRVDERSASVPAAPDTVTQERVLDAFVNDDPRTTALLVERVGADEETVERALRRLERRGVLERRERDARTTLWLPARRRGGGVGYDRPR
jgi:ribosomal protein S25